MSMFTPYENLNPDYSPNNINIPTPSPRRKLYQFLPIEERNIVGKFVGCSFNYGDTLSLVFDINPKIKVEADAIVYEITGQEPTSSTEGHYGQRAYNTVDLKVWICKTLDQTVYEWEEEKDFTYPCYGEQEVVVKLYGDSVENNNFEVTISNFRMEEVITFSTDKEPRVTSGINNIKIFIDEEISKLLLKGVYYTTVKMIDEGRTKIIYEYTLIVK
ncbi:MAG: hypothetical protein J6S67_19405 [Methanobrevibacter sp.]|nr:hypothetical protein [Methanobrevibacter sp.]